MTSSELNLRSVFHHHDVQSVTTEISKLSIKQLLSNRKNTTTGASAASSANKSNLQQDFGDFVENELVLSCPHFRNEIPSTSTPPQPTCPSNFLLDESMETEKNEKTRFLDNLHSGAGYYRKYFSDRAHDNWFAVDDNLGPVAISVAKEGEGEDLFWRVIFRTSELSPLRGSVSSSSIVMTTNNKNVKHGNPSRDVVECLFPFLTSSTQPLRLGLPTAPPILLKLDEQSLTSKHKVGILYCRPGQHTEEEMYNNEFGSQNFDDFLALVGERVRLRGFGGYNGGLDVRDDTTGSHTHYNASLSPSLQIIFHVSTLLPFTPNNRQQLLRKRHIGNDIVTIIFQEQGCAPFTPKSVRSQFQHVFVVVRVLATQPAVVYGLSISRSAEVPPFGPPLTTPSFHGDAQFVTFLLSKIINGENATYKSEKFTTMATRTRNEYLKDLYLNYTGGGGVAELRGRFSMLNLIKKKTTTPPALSPNNCANCPGALSWRLGDDSFVALSRFYLLGCHDNSVDFVVKVEDIVAWETGKGGLTIYHLTKQENHTHPTITSTLPIPMTTEQTFRLVTKLKSLNKVAMETATYFIRKKHNLGFHIQNDGLITDVEAASPAGAAGLRCFSRVVKINSQQTSKLNSEQMIELLKNCVAVEIVVILPEVVGHLPLATTQHQHHHPTTPTLPTTPPQKNHGNHLNCFGEGSILCSPLKNNNYASSSGYGTGSSSASFSRLSSSPWQPPPQLPPRCHSNSKSSENVFKARNNSVRHTVYGDFAGNGYGCYGDRESNLNQRVAALKSAYLTPKKRVFSEKKEKRGFFEQELLKLIDIEGEPPTYSSITTTYSNNNSTSSGPSPKIVQNVALETRVALLEAQLAEERALKMELKNSLAVLREENKKLAEEHQGNKKDVERLKLLLL